MSRITRSFRRPVYLIPSVVAIAAVLALTLFPWKVDKPGGYTVAFAGVDKDLALQQYGVQRVLQRLGINGADVEVGDCEASCNLTIRDLHDEKEVGKVVSVMYQLSDCELLEVAQEGNVTLSTPVQKSFTFEADGNVTCDFTHELSDEDLAQIQVVVNEIQFGGGAESSWVSDSGQTLHLVKISNCQTPCVLPTGDSVTFTFKACGESALKDSGQNEHYFGDEAPAPEPDPRAKHEASSGPISGFQLNQNYPNPFNAGTTISFTVPEDGASAALEVYNIKGQLVKTLVDRRLAAGPHEITWDATDSHGNPVASGVYLYRLTAGDYVETKKMSLLK